MARARSTWWRSMVGGRTQSTFAFAFALSNLLQLALCLKGRLVGQLENFMRGICGKVNAWHVLNDMHDERSIWIVLHHILTSHENLVPNITTDGELGELIAKAIKYNLGILTKISRVTYLGIQDLTKNIVENIVVGLQPNGLPISTMTIQIHVLILIHSKSWNLSDGSGGVIPAVQTKKARKGNEINLVVLAFGGAWVSKW